LSHLALDRRVTRLEEGRRNWAFRLMIDLWNHPIRRKFRRGSVLVGRGHSCRPVVEGDL